MKPIFQMTREEKLQEIVEYSPQGGTQHSPPVLVGTTPQ